MTARLVILVWLAFSGVAAWAAEARIVKVLPHLLDAQGRNALSPSLFERDAYQAHLRDHPELITALRFDVQMKNLPRNRPLRLQLEVRGSKMAVREVRRFETEVRRRGLFSPWGKISLDKRTTEEVGSIVAWRASLWDGDRTIAFQESFLW